MELTRHCESVCVCVFVGGGGGQRERERERERDKHTGLCLQSLRLPVMCSYPVFMSVRVCVCV